MWYSYSSIDTHVIHYTHGANNLYVELSRSSKCDSKELFSAI